MKTFEDIVQFLERQSEHGFIFIMREAHIYYGTLDLKESGRHARLYFIYEKSLRGSQYEGLSLFHPQGTGGQQRWDHLLTVNIDQKGNDLANIEMFGTDPSEDISFHLSDKLHGLYYIIDMVIRFFVKEKLIPLTKKYPKQTSHAACFVTQTRKDFRRLFKCPISEVAECVEELLVMQC